MNKIIAFLFFAFLSFPLLSFGQQAGNSNPENRDVFLDRAGIAKFVGADYISGKQSQSYQKNPAELTKDELVDVIGDYIHEKSKKNGGYLHVYDDIVNHSLDLSLLKVHGDCLKYLGDSLYFDCGYFTGKRDGNRYDIDIFMKWDGAKLHETKTIVHKVNYMPRFDWVDGGTTFKAIPLNKKAIEHYRKLAKQKMQ